MKDKIVLLFTALLLFGFAQAQVSKESYEKAVDLLNCKTVELSLKDDKNLTKFKTDCPCGKTGNTQIAMFLNSVKLDATLALSNEVNELKKSFTIKWKKDEVITLLSETIFTDNKFQKIIAFAKKRNGNSEFNAYKSNLKTDLAKTLIESVSQESVSPKNTLVQQSNNEERILILEENQKAQKVSESILFGLGDYLILFSILLSAIALFLGIRKKSGNDYELSIEIKNYVRKKIDETNWNTSTPNNNVGSAELRDVKNRIRDLEAQIEKIKSQIINLNPVSNYTAQTIQPTIQEIKQPEVITQTFFLSTPNSDGSFNESSSLSTYKDGATIYRFTKTGNNRAKFQIDEKDASTRLALQYPDKNIDPVCDAVNAFNPMASKITTVEPGAAELIGSKWIVNNKAKIRYEN